MELSFGGDEDEGEEEEEGEDWREGGYSTSPVAGERAAGAGVARAVLSLSLGLSLGGKGFLPGQRRHAMVRVLQPQVPRGARARRGGTWWAGHLFLAPVPVSEGGPPPVARLQQQSLGANNAHHARQLKCVSTRGLPRQRHCLALPPPASLSFIRLRHSRRCS